MGYGDTSIEKGISNELGELVEANGYNKLNLESDSLSFILSSVIVIWSCTNWVISLGINFIICNMRKIEAPFLTRFNWDYVFGITPRDCKCSICVGCHSYWREDTWTQFMEWIELEIKGVEADIQGRQWPVTGRETWSLSHSKWLDMF